MTAEKLHAVHRQQGDCSYDGRGWRRYAQGGGAHPRHTQGEPAPRPTTIPSGRRDHTYNILYGEGWREDVNIWGSRARYAETLNPVVEDREEVVVTRAGHEPVVTVALDDYESRKETAYLLRSPANARRLWESIERGGGSGRASPPA